MNISADKFEAEKFYCSDISYSPIYSWVWNGPITREKTYSQLVEMQRLGIKRFYIIPEPKLFRPKSIPTELEPDYLTDAFMQEIRYAIEKAKKLGMHCWIYDEGGWPSGGACGAVLKKHPEYARRTACCIETNYPAGNIYKKSREDICATFINETEMITEGYLFTADTNVTEYYSRPTLFADPASPDFPDLTIPEATDCFIELTHEKYAEALSDFFGNHISALFTDEPTAPRPFPFRDDIVKAYEEEYGESPLPALPALCGKVNPDEQTAEICIKWYDLCSKLFCENFLKRCKTWTNANKMDFTGHMDIDHTAMGAIYGGNFHLLRSLRVFDIPGIDVIWRQIFPSTDDISYLPEDEHPNSFYPRYASSAAVQSGSNAVMTESLGVYGNGITYDQMRFVFGFQAIRGVNIFNLMALSYADEAYHIAGELPAFREDYACFKDLSDWNKYLERLSYVSSTGKRVCDTALYYPIRDMWSGINAKETASNFENTGKSLEDKQIDFDIIDDDILENATNVEKGVISYGNAHYTRIVLPECRYISEKSKQILETFKANGGIVLYGADDILPPFEIVGNAKGLQMMHRQTDSQDIYCLFNQNITPSEFYFDFGERNGFYIDITSGELLPLVYENNLIKVTLNCGETCAICLSDNIPDLCINPSFKNSLELNGEYTFKRLTSLEISNHSAKSREINENVQPIQLGDWAYITGKEFSGSGMYETVFSKPDCNCSKFLLDLGDVRYTCEVILNGISLGKKLMPPYRYTISDELIKPDNTMQIIVKNTAGNQFQYTDYFDTWPEWMLTPYFEKEKNFDKDTLSSGLFGPVKLLY